MTRHFTARRLAVSLMGALLAIGATAPAFALPPDRQDRNEDRADRKPRKQQVDREESGREQPQRQEPQRQPAQRKATPAPAQKANGNGKPEKESTPHTRFHGQGASTFGPNWDDVRPLLAKHVAGSDTSNDITDANKDALYENFKMNSRAWQKWAREGMDEAQLIVLLPESVEIQIAGNPFESVPEMAA